MSADLYLLTWCPGKSPPDKCDLCACQWVDAGFLQLSSLSGVRTYVGQIQLNQLIGCSPPSFGVELWQDQSAYGGASLYWFGAAILATDPYAGAAAQITFTYRFTSGGLPQETSLFTLSGSTVLAPDGQVPKQWLGTRTFKGIYDSSGHFVTNVIYYSVWSGAPSMFIHLRPGGPMYGFVYGGPLSADLTQTFAAYSQVSGGALGGSPVGGSPLFYMS